MAEEYDLVILGGGTGGYVAAVRAAQNGRKVAIVEKGKLGGTCLHKGCIPSKALLRSAEVFATAKDANKYGVLIQDLKLDFQAVQSRKETIVNQLHQGVQALMKKGKIDVYEGKGRILGPSIFSPRPGTISVEMNDGTENMMLVPENIIIATGSSPKSLPGLDVDGHLILDSDGALELEQLPSSILIVGGGVIGIEWASMLADFGVDVTVLEYGNTILPQADKDIAKEATKLLKQRGIQIVTNAKIDADSLKKGEDVTVSVDVLGEKIDFTAEKMLISVGRAANVDDIGLVNTEIEIEKGYIKVNEFYQTKESHIYAIGDVIGGLQLAHVASHEGLIAVEHLSQNHPQRLDEQTIATCVYSRPEMASVGLTEQKARELGFRVKIGKFPFKANGKALVYGEAEGFVKVIANADNHDLLGVHMIGPHVTDLISEAALAKVLDAADFEIAEMIHPHPTLSEIIGEAALAVDGRAIHM
ncbi:dihydrolipoamide dehydrogenase [Alkalihalobacillus alcalophilus ATCC 27647 = CGMCC 1.3604]|uniref:Dihydrolipoyl dehydrogenase n=1 Tax=Alkalihalobacillus alcalophilus ATCC 27647 = CGMCC 1.3604 TaxID=1218173 RepID=A0A094WM05_ALKAL|nr:dihydrolipoyl dehydrogenase [Alkalihalobacillus alcalophilus]KGA97886.1 dihydrolipoamide dehydrogenase [Alkalihalobacillus alcalophilus ATCC 27647 = CGMCC 1.3604]MED1562133.1 dihydrolipoyl dehydrogenase [Alkalihalobacillus alcalophilus]THG89861.1 dihydrolipoamide dehydrogenase [Alkalihalobacillus alcalophilus ATCC 27647 = CGMCC 1.3604]